MNRKHFVAIAQTLSANKADFALCADMADTLEEFNPLFDRQKFLVVALHGARMQAEADARFWDSVQAGRVS